MPTEPTAGGLNRYAHQGPLLIPNWLPIDKMEWDINGAEESIREAFERNSETDLLEVLRKNSFLFYDLVGRKYGVQPIFHEVRLGAKLRCDFAWVNDHSYGPEWVLVEVEKPERVSRLISLTMQLSRLDRGIGTLKIILEVRRRSSVLCTASDL